MKARCVEQQITGIEVEKANQLSCFIDTVSRVRSETMQQQLLVPREIRQKIKMLTAYEIKPFREFDCDYNFTQFCYEITVLRLNYGNSAMTLEQAAGLTGLGISTIKRQLQLYRTQEAGFQGAAAGETVEPAYLKPRDITREVLLLFTKESDQQARTVIAKKLAVMSPEIYLDAIIGNNTSDPIGAELLSADDLLELFTREVKTLVALQLHINLNHGKYFVEKPATNLITRKIERLELCIEKLSAYMVQEEQEQTA